MFVSGDCAARKVPHECADLLHRRYRQAFAVAKAADKLSIVDGKAPKSAFGHLQPGLCEEMLNLGKQRICGHGRVVMGYCPSVNGLLPK